MTTPVKVAVLSGFGLNCDYETAHAFELAGARPEVIHLNDLIRGKRGFGEFQLLAFIGGFSWGDDHGAGVVQAVRLKTRLGGPLREFIAAGNLVIGICNGFQTLVNLGLLAGLDNDYTRRSVALIHNDCGNFRNDWVHLRVNRKSPCVFTRGLERLELPVRHGEGKFFTDEDTLARIRRQGQIVLQYATAQGNLAQGQFPQNPNGALEDIAGICDPSGRVFGLMPHPEAFHDWTNHPDWTRQKKSLPGSAGKNGPGVTPGIQILKNGVDFIGGHSP